MRRFESRATVDETPSVDATRTAALAKPFRKMLSTQASLRKRGDCVQMTGHPELTIRDLFRVAARIKTPTVGLLRIGPSISQGDYFRYRK